MRTFLDLHPNYSKSRYTILPVPFDGTTSFLPGTRFGPDYLLLASTGLEEFDLNTLTYIPEDIYTHQIVEMPSLPEKVIDFVEKSIYKDIKKDKFPVVIGGEHTITFGAIKAINKKVDFTLISIDAHFDLRDKYGGTKLNHATIMRRISEIIPVRFIGQRVADKEEIDYLSTNKYVGRGIEGIKTDNVYISFDLDVFDPSVEPAVSNPEVDGLFWGDIMKMLNEIYDRFNVVGFDIVELQPIGNPFFGSVVAANLLKNMIILKEKERR